MKFLNGQLQLDSSLTGTTALFTSGLTVGSGQTSSSGIARGQLLNSNLTASANNNVLVGLDINPTFTNGAFTGTENIHIRSISAVNETVVKNILLKNTGIGGGSGVSIGFNNLAGNNLSHAFIKSYYSGGMAISFGTGGGSSLLSEGTVALVLNSDQTANFTGKVTVNSGGLQVVGISANMLMSDGSAPVITRNGSTGIQFLKDVYWQTFSVFTNNVENLRITGVGNILMGTTTDLGFKLSVSGSTLLRGSGTTSASYALATQNSSGGTTMVVNNAGNMLIGTTTDAGYKLDVNGTARLNSTTLIEGPLTVNYGSVVGGTSIVANGNTQHNGGRGIYTTGYAYGIQATHTMVGNWNNQPNAAGVHGTGQIGVFGSGDIAGFSGPSAFFTVLNGNSRVSARSHISTFQIRGSGSTELTNTLLLENSSGIKTFTVNDNGNVLIGLSGSTGQKLQVSGTSLFMGVIPFSANNQTIAMVDIQPNFNRASYTGTTALALRVSGGTQIIGSGSTGTTLSVFSVDGASGRLFDVSDDLSSTLFSVNTIAGLPVIEAFANNAVVMGKYNQNTLVVSGTSVGIGTSSPQAKLDVNGTMLLGSLSGDPSGANGMIYYNTTTNKFRGYENGAWENLIG